jgi:hypothetical protein
MPISPLPMDPGDPGQPKTKLGRVDGSEAGAERRLVRDGLQVLAHGALVCPHCALPLAIGGRLSAGLRLRCGFCDHTAPAREFVAEDVYDTLTNEVYLVARLA